MATQQKKFEISTQISTSDNSIEFQVFEGEFNGTNYDVVSIRKTIVKDYIVDYNQAAEVITIQAGLISVTIDEEIIWNTSPKSPADIYDEIRTSRGY